MSQMCGTQEFCLDLVDCPEAVAAYRDRHLAAWLESAAFWREFFRRNGYPGTTNWASAFSPDEYDQIQCDFCLMVGPDIFSWLIAPEQRAEAAFFGGAVYHLDGPGAVAHLDALLEIPHLKAIQWVPGAGQPTAGGWIPLLQRIQAAGKAIQIYAKAAEVPIYKEHLRPEGLMLHFAFDEWGLSESQCEDLMRSIEAWPGRGTAVTVPAGAAESVTDDGIILLRLTAAEGGPGPTCLDVHLVHRGNHFARGFAERFNRAAHDVDASGLMIEGDQLGGLLRIVLQPDQWHPKAPVSCEFEIAASAVAPGQWQGVYKGTVGDSTVAGEVRAEDEPSASAADYRNATARLYLHDGFLTDDWDRDAAAELDVRDEAIVKAVAFREGAAEMDVGSLRLTPESLTGECRVTHRGQAPCAMRFAGTVVGRWIGGVLELAAEGQAPARRTFRGYVVFTKDSSVPAARGPASPVSDPTPLWSTERTIRREILKAKARALTDAFEARSFTPPNGAVMVYRLFRPSAHGNAGKRPLVLFLHGADARGADNARNYTHHGMLLGARIWALPEYQARHPCLVVVPQTMDHWAGASLDAALALVDALCGEFDVDRDRIYVTGLSLGGFGTFNALAARPRMFAAAVPVCGGGKPETAASFAHVPMWVFHGARDELVKPEESRRMVEALRRAGGAPAYTEYEGVGHNSFMDAYSEPALVDWVMNQGLGVRR
jgi:dienelactone hydrolase